MAFTSFIWTVCQGEGGIVVNQKIILKIKKKEEWEAVFWMQIN